MRKRHLHRQHGYIYFGGVIAELNPATGAWTDYIFASGKRIAKDTSNNGSGAQYYQGDHLGSARLITDASGIVISSCTYAPYGEQVGCSPDNTSNHYRFTGKERDPETGIDYFGARYYASGLGRFMTPDWSVGPVTVPYAHLDNPQTLNLYAYVDNNPINSIDADGHSRNEYMVAGPGWDLTGVMSDGTGSDTDSGENGAAIDAWNAYATQVNQETAAYNQLVDEFNQQVDAYNQSLLESSFQGKRDPSGEPLPPKVPKGDPEKGGTPEIKPGMFELKCDGTRERLAINLATHGSNEPPAGLDRLTLKGTAELSTENPPKTQSFIHLDGKLQKTLDPVVFIQYVTVSSFAAKGTLSVTITGQFLDHSKESLFVSRDITLVCEF